MAKKNSKKGHGLTYFLDHPQVKRYPSVGNQDPKPFIGGTQTSAQAGKMTQGTKGATGGTGNIKTNLGKLLSGK